MKFTRRPDLDPQTRIDIVMLAWLHQGVYGKMTEIARLIRYPRTFLYQLLLMATSNWKRCLAMKSSCFKKIIGHLEPAALVVTLGRKLLASEYRFDFEGSGIPPQFRGLSQSILPQRGAALPSTLVMPSKTLGVLSQR